MAMQNKKSIEELKEQGVDLFQIEVFKDVDGVKDESTKKTFIMRTASRKAQAKAAKVSNNMADVMAFSESIIYSCVVDGDKEALSEDWVFQALLEKSDMLIQKTHATVKKL